MHALYTTGPAALLVRRSTLPPRKPAWTTPPARAAAGAAGPGPGDAAAPLCRIL